MMELEQTIDLEQFKKILQDAAAIVNDKDGQQLDVTYKTPKQPVTEVDLAVDQYLQNTLNKIFPQAGWLSEETEEDPQRLEKDWMWIVDPLDGTKEYVKGIPEYAVSVALAYCGKPRLGGIINPATGEGAIGYVEEKKIVTWGLKRDKTESFLVSRTEFARERMKILLNKGLPFIPTGGIAYKFMCIAASISPATFTLTAKSEWDICGGMALLQAAQLECRRLDGRELLFNQKNTRITGGIIAGNRAKVDYLEDIIKKEFTDL